MGSVEDLLRIYLYDAFIALIFLAILFPGMWYLFHSMETSINEMNNSPESSIINAIPSATEIYNNLVTVSSVSLSGFEINGTNATFSTAFYTNSYSGYLYLVVYESPNPSVSPSNFPLYHVYYGNTEAEEDKLNDAIIYGLYPVYFPIIHTLENVCPYPVFKGNITVYKVPVNTPITVVVQNYTPNNHLIIWYIYNYNNLYLFRVGNAST